jgi:hypothetical protein
VVGNGCRVELEVESAVASDGWTLGTNVAAFSGSGHLTWNGARATASANAGKFGLLSYTVNVPAAGTYKLSIRNYHTNQDATEGNDVWVRVGATAEWLKVFNGIVNRWNYVTFVDPGQGCSWKGLPE